ncbi:MAG: hypothetical protein BWY81_00496 [Firmicutes bacterium ADurb.Bin467]|nr:MAG: hypothetical protein BWY81_00496 [Firmicutes bacterium ADurb.Bin467]
MRFLKGFLWWLAQAAASLAVCTLLTLLIWLDGTLYAVASWAAMPVIGLFTAYFVARRGVNNYLAWIAPPVCLYAAHLIVTGYAPNSVGPALFTAFLSIVGAAAGLVQNGRTANK